MIHRHEDTTLLHAHVAIAELDARIVTLQNALETILVTHYDAMQVLDALEANPQDDAIVFNLSSRLRGALHPHHTPIVHLVATESGWVVSIQENENDGTTVFLIQSTLQDAVKELVDKIEPKGDTPQDVLDRQLFGEVAPRVAEIAIFQLALAAPKP